MHPYIIPRSVSEFTNFYPSKPIDQSDTTHYLGYPVSELSEDIGNAALQYLVEGLDELERTLLQQPGLSERPLDVSAGVEGIYTALGHLLNKHLDVFEPTVEKFILRVPEVVNQTLLRERVSQLAASSPAPGSHTLAAPVFPADGPTLPADQVREDVATLEADLAAADAELSSLRETYLHRRVYCAALEARHAALMTDLRHLHTLKREPDADATLGLIKAEDAPREREAKRPYRPALVLAPTPATAADGDYGEAVRRMAGSVLELHRDTELLCQLSAERQLADVGTVAAAADHANTAAAPSTRPAFALDLAKVWPAAAEPER
jgi:hypothetical protein